jgi:GNAT superfamily N-acetyltransferase
MLSIIKADSARLLKTFVFLPEKLNRQYPNYTPPLFRDEIAFLDPLKNRQLANSEHICFLAFEGRKPVGRIMGIISHTWNKLHGMKQARFYQFESYNDDAIAEKLFEAVENWAVDKGMNEMIGSFGFSDKDPQGIQTEGFEYPAVIASVSHQPYLEKLVTARGYVKFKDCLSYRFFIPEHLPEQFQRIYDRISRNNKVQLLEFRKRSELKPFFTPVMQLMNVAYSDIFGFEPMTYDDIKKMADQYLSVLDPRLVKVVADKNSQPVAFIIAMANISEGMKKANGRLFPFGFIHILLAMKQSQQLDLLLGAIAPEFRGRGINVLMGISLMETARKLGMNVIDSHLILEENRLMRAEMEKLGGVISKRFRIFKKKIDDR